MRFEIHYHCFGGFHWQIYDSERILKLRKHCTTNHIHELSAALNQIQPRIRLGYSRERALQNFANLAYLKQNFEKHKIVLSPWKKRFRDRIAFSQLTVQVLLRWPSACSLSLRAPPGLWWQPTSPRGTSRCAERLWAWLLSWPRGARVMGRQVAQTCEGPF